jgi:3-oxoacyl-[acyl-carrier-protein] synthase II
MSRTERNARARRELLRERLERLVARNDAGAALLDVEIDDLLKDILEDDLAPQPAPAWADDRDEDERVVVTGMGVVTPLGIGLEPFWSGLVAGRSGVGPISLCDPGDSPSTIAAEVPGFEPRDYMDAKEARRVSRASQFAVAAARMALADSGFTVTDDNRHEVGALIANGSSSPPDTENAARTLFERGFGRVNPFYITGSLPNMPSCQVAIHLGLLGYNTAIATACELAAQAVAIAVL